MARKKVLLYSRLAFYPMHWQAFKIICEQHNLEPYIITTDYCDLPQAHKQLGWADPIAEAKMTGFSPKVYYISQGSSLSKALNIFRYLHQIKPDLVWAQEQPNMPFIFVLLAYYRFSLRKPKIIAAICENAFSTPSLLMRMVYSILWPRIDGLVAVATDSIKSLQSIGMSKSTPAATLVAGCLSPEKVPLPRTISLRNQEDDVIFGFVGRLIPEKGWRVIIEALHQLPENYKLVMAADGIDRQAFETLIIKYGLQKRVENVGFIPKDELWSLYAAMDCLIVPSLTTPAWREQFGGILADAMAVGIPIIGSDSGAIPEVTGPAGIIVPENNPEALAVAMKKLYHDVGLRKSLGENGQKRFAEEFSISAYAKKIAAGLGLTN